MRRAKSCTTSSDDDAPSVRPAFEPPSSSTLPARLPQAPLQPTQAPATIRLAFECKVETKWGDTAVLVGAADKLGAWSPDRGVPMFTDESCYPVWKADVSLLCASDELEYKIVILRGDGTGPEWEPLQNNRKLARAKARSVRVRAAWGVPGADEQPQAESRASTSSSSSFPLVGTTPTQEQAFAAPAPAATEVGERAVRQGCAFTAAASGAGQHHRRTPAIPPTVQQAGSITPLCTQRRGSGGASSGAPGFVTAPPPNASFSCLNSQGPIAPTPAATNPTPLAGASQSPFTTTAPPSRQSFSVLDPTQPPTPQQQVNAAMEVALRGGGWRVEPAAASVMAAANRTGGGGGGGVGGGCICPPSVLGGGACPTTVLPLSSCPVNSPGHQAFNPVRAMQLLHATSEVGRPLDIIKSQDESWPPSLTPSLRGSIDYSNSELSMQSGCGNGSNNNLHAGGGDACSSNGSKCSSSSSLR